MSVNASEHFGRRADAVFGALDNIAQCSVASGHNQSSGPSTQWSIARQQVYRAGHEEADSSEEEDAKNSAQQQSESLLNTMLDAQDGNVQLDQQGNIIQPSLAFCQALDNEQEYDDVDAVAGTTLRGVSDPADVKPSRLTEVLDDNVFDQRMRAHKSAQPSSNHNIVSDMDIDNQAATSSETQKDSWTMGGRPQQGRGGRPPGRPPLSGRRPGHSRSRVPLHVQHPEKYTCYVLDEPLVVGGGDKAAGLSSQAELEKAARAASSAALAAQQQTQHQEPTEPLPAFGSGIQFVRPNKKARQQGSTAAPVLAVSVVKSVIPESMDDDDQNNEEDELPLKKSYPVEASCMDDDFGEGAHHAAPARPRRRQYRVKAI
ncbi:TPA: hypothetical protein ACH3X3_014628 [Trebouxia sp. C0006]